MAEYKDSNLWIVGVILSIGGTIASNGGINLQKVAIMRELRRPKGKQRPYPCQPLWLLGFIGVVGGAIGDFGSLAFAAQSLLIPLGGCTLLANIYFARLCLGEQLTRRDCIATVIILIGIIMVAVTGSKEEASFTMQQLIALYAESAFIGYLFVVGLCILLLYAYVRYGHRLRAKYGLWSKEYKTARRSHLFAMPLLAGFIGAQTIWTAKSVAEMVKTSVRGDNQVRYFGFWALLITMLVTVVSQLHFLSMSLRYAPALLVIPVFQSVFITLSIIGGGVYFQELKVLSGIQLGIFMMGLIILLFGMWLLSKRKIDGPAPPSKLLLYAHIVRFMVRTRALTRQEQADKWPNRLELYSCECDCHTLTRTVLGGRTRTLETILDDDEEEGGVSEAQRRMEAERDDMDELDYALAKGIRIQQPHEQQQMQQQLSDRLDVNTASSRRAIRENSSEVLLAGMTSPEGGSSPRSFTPLAKSAPAGKAAPLKESGVRFVIAEDDGEGLVSLKPPTQTGGPTVGLPGCAGRRPLLPPVKNRPDAPPMCQHCLCRVTPQCLLQERKAIKNALPLATALVHSLPQAGSVTVDAGLRQPQHGMRTSSIGAPGDWDQALADVASGDKLEHMPAGLKPSDAVGAERRGRRSLTVNEVNAVMGKSAVGRASGTQATIGAVLAPLANLAHATNPLASGFYDASDPVAPSYFKPHRGRVGTYPNAQNSEDGSEEEEDAVTQAITHLGEGIAKFGARTGQSLRSGITAVTSRLRRGTAGSVAGLEGDSMGTLAPQMPVPAGSSSAAGDVSVPEIQRTKSTPPIVAVLKPVAEGITTTASDVAAEITSAVDARHGFRKMSEDETGSPERAAAVSPARPPAPPPRLRGNTADFVLAKGTPSVATESPLSGHLSVTVGGSSDEEGYRSAEGMRHKTERSKSLHLGDGAVSHSAGVTPITRPSRRRPTRRGTGYATNTMPLPNSMVVGAGLEGISAVTVAAFKKLFTASTTPSASNMEPPSHAKHASPPVARTRSASNKSPAPSASTISPVKPAEVTAVEVRSSEET